MRILVTGQAASGLFILADLLRRIYGLADLNSAPGGPPRDSRALAAWIHDGKFPDQGLLAGHYEAEEELLRACRDHGVRVLCMARDPYLTFEVLYIHANGDRGVPSVPESSSLRNAELDSPAVADFIREVFSRQLGITARWQESGEALMVRQEALVTQPGQVMETLAADLGGMEADALADALDEIVDKGVQGSAGNPLSDSRLPSPVICELDKVIPQAFFELGYERRPCAPEAVMNDRLRHFSRFIDLYNDKQRVFLVGHGKSGTTWLHMLFFHHPNAAVVAERRLFEHPDENEALLDNLLDDAWFESWFRSSSFGVTSPEQTQVRYELSRLMSDYLLYRALAVRKTAKGFERNEPITHFSEKIALNTE